MEDNVNEERSSILKSHGGQATFREKWKNKEYRARSLQSLSICASFLALGVNAGQIGPTLLDLMILTNTDLVKASSFITAGAAGDLSGTTVCGIIFGKLDPELLIFMAVLMEGMATMVTPLCSNYELMLFIRYVTFFSAGLINTSANAMIMSIWGRDGHRWMHFLHFCFALGGVLSPLYTVPFLAPNQPEYDDNNSKLNGSFLSHQTKSFRTENSGLFSHRETNVKYAFMISGSFTILMSLPLLAFYIKNRKKTGQKKCVETNIQRQLPKGVLIFTLFILCIFIMVYAFAEFAFASFLLTFLVIQYECVTKSKGAFVVAIFWTHFAIGRFLMVIVSKVFSPVQILGMSISLMVLAFAGFLIMAEIEIINAVIGFSALVGVSTSGVYAATLSWTEAELLKVTGFVAGAFIIFSSSATMINPLVVGRLMMEVGNMWFCYLTLGSSIVLAFVFIILLVYSRQYLNQRYGPCASGLEGEINHQKP